MYFQHTRVMLRVILYVVKGEGYSGVHTNFVRGGEGVQQIRLRTEDRENGDLGAVAP